MNEIERQILLNQVDIMRKLKGWDISFNIRLQETSDLLNPKQTEESACDMGEDDAKSREDAK